MTTPSTFNLFVDADGFLTCPIQTSIEEVIPIITLAVPSATPKVLPLDNTLIKLSYLLAHTYDWVFLSILEFGRHKLRIAHALPSWLPVFMDRRHSQRPGPSPTLGSFGPSYQQRHKSRVSLRGLPCTHVVLGTSYGNTTTSRREHTWMSFCHQLWSGLFQWVSSLPLLTIR